MANRPKNKFTLKIILSYMVLIVLAIVSGYFIFSEIKVYLANEPADEGDAKLLKASSLVTELYEAESLSKLALQTRTKANFNAYSQKIDSIFIEIDSLKLLTESENQQTLLDSVQVLLTQKVANSNELRNLKVRNEANNYSIDDAIKEFDKIEESLGRFSARNLFPNFDKLSPKVQKSLQEYVTLINNNAPKNPDGSANPEYIDSILDVSKSLLTEAKLKDTRTQRSLARKEIEINKNDLELSQQLRNIITALEQEIMVNTYNDNIRKRAAVRRSIRLAGLAAILGFIIVGVFTFLINRDFWRVQTYRQKLENEKKFSESVLKSREQLIATVSHDLRTPLNTITGYSELMESTGLSEKQSTYIQNVKSASKYVDSLVNDLLDFSKLEAGKIKVEEIPFVLSNLIRETAENLREINHGKKIDLQLHIDKKLDLAVIGDPFRLRQILTNLIGNAYKFTDEGFIRVTAKSKQDTDDRLLTTIKVTDSGIGIRKEKQHAIFREFTQAEDHTDKKYGGYGLGLTISKKLTELIGGSISLKSEEGKGSTFTVKIPLQLTKQLITTPKRLNLRRDNALSLLIVDDDTAMLQLLREVCENLQIDAHLFSDFEDIEKKASLQYDLVLTDIQMPNVDGFEVLQRLKNSDFVHFKNQPVIAMTGRRDLDLKVYSDAGFSDVMQKPFTKSQFLKVLNRFVPGQFLTKKEGKSPKSGKTASKMYSLELISSFLGDNEEAVNEVLQTFVMDTKNNLQELGTAVKTADYPKLNNVAHRMLPMFRQLKVGAAVDILEKFETGTADEIKTEAMKQYYGELSKRTEALLVAIQSRLAKNPSYSD